MTEDERPWTLCVVTDCRCEGREHKLLEMPDERIEITDKMVSDCMENMVLSRTHVWEDGQQAEYNMLKAAGRRFYDQLRTKYNVGHIQAYVWAADLFGRK